MDDLADMFLQWQARKAMAKLGRQRRSYYGSGATLGGGEGVEQMKWRVRDFDLLMVGHCSKSEILIQY